MGAVHIGVGHDHYLVIAQFGKIEVFINARPHSADNRADLFVSQNPVEPCFLHIENLAAQGQDGLDPPIPALLGRPSGGVPLHQKELTFLRILAATVGQLARQVGKLEGIFTARQFPGLPGRFARPGGANRFIDNPPRSRRVLLEEGIDPLVANRIDGAVDLAVAQPRFGLPFKLGLMQLDAQDCGEPLTDIITGKIALILFEQPFTAGVVIDQAGQRSLESLFVGAAFFGMDIVGVGVDRLAVAALVLQGKFNLEAVNTPADIDRLSRHHIFALI